MVIPPRPIRRDFGVMRGLLDRLIWESFTYRRGPLASTKPSTKPWLLFLASAPTQTLTM